MHACSANIFRYILWHNRHRNAYTHPANAYRRIIGLPTQPTYPLRIVHRAHDYVQYNGATLTLPLLVCEVLNLFHLVVESFDSASHTSLVRGLTTSSYSSSSSSVGCLFFVCTGYILLPSKCIFLRDMFIEMTNWSRTRNERETKVNEDAHKLLAITMRRM